jgi:hypothetical protein
MGVAVRKETPVCRFEQLVDLDTGYGFLIGHLRSFSVRVVKHYNV